MSIPLPELRLLQVFIHKVVRCTQHWQAGQALTLIPKDKGVLVMPVPNLKELAGIAKGACKEGYRNRNDRY